MPTLTFLPHRKGNSIFDPWYDGIVIPVNTEGVAGKGLALEARLLYPANFNAYVYACSNKELTVGGQTYCTKDSETGKYIFNYATKEKWRDPSQYSWVDPVCIHILLDRAEGLGVTNLAIPALGCGLGGLRWSVVRAKIEMAFKNFETAQPDSKLNVVVFEP